MLITLIAACVPRRVLGFLIGIARLSRNWLLSTLAGAYVEVVRNIPLLFFVLFWYFGVIAALPGAAPVDRDLRRRVPQQSRADDPAAELRLRRSARPRSSILRRCSHPDGFRLAGRAGAATAPARTRRCWTIGTLLLVVAAGHRAHARRRCRRRWDVPALRGFNYRGGFVLVPEFVALFAALITYTAALHRRDRARRHPGGAARARSRRRRRVGLRRAQILRLVVIPQALRVMIPPMTSQYLNVLKNSSFGAAIAYPELVSVFMGSALNNTGQAIEIIAITLAVYLVDRPRRLGAS